MAKVMVSMPEDLLRAIDDEAKATGRTRSGLLQYAARLYLTGKAAQVPPGQRPEVRQAMERVRRTMERYGDSLAGDSTALIREARDTRYGDGSRSTGKRRSPRSAD